MCSVRRIWTIPIWCLALNVTSSFIRWCSASTSGAITAIAPWPIRSPPMPERNAKRWWVIWAIPLAWVIVAALSLRFQGGENVTLFVGLLPGLYVAKIFGYDGSSQFGLSSPSSWPYLFFGALPLLVCAGLLHMARLRARTFLTAYVVGICLAGALLQHAFLLEVSRSGLARAAQLFDLNQPERVVALIVACFALGLYLSLPFSAAAAIYRKLKRPAAVAGLLLLLFSTGCVGTPSERLLKDFPALRLADGSKGRIEWTKFDGFDFLVFYGAVPSDPSAGAGIYQGGDPQFRPPRGQKPIPGKLGVFNVDWYNLPDKGAKFYRTCLVDYQKTTVQRGRRTLTYTTKRHVWVYADTEESLNALVAELDKLAMFATRPPDLVE
jgi:hypothetical protein